MCNRRKLFRLFNGEVAGELKAPLASTAPFMP